MPKTGTDPFKIWSRFQLWHFFQGGTKLPAWPKISPIDGTYRVGRHGHRLIFAGNRRCASNSSWNFHSIIGKCIKINVVSVHFSVTTLFKYKTTFEVTDPPARAYFIVLGNREMKSDWFKFRLRTFLKIEWIEWRHRLYKIEITLSIQAICKEVGTWLRCAPC